MQFQLDGGGAKVFSHCVTPRQSKTERERVREKTLMDWTLTFVVVFITFLYWRVRRSIRMLEEWRDDQRYNYVEK